MKHHYHPDGAPAPDGWIFCFGSNLSGIHGAGAARAAMNHYGAKWGVAEGIQGKSYAIPTVKHQIRGPLDLQTIENHVNGFIQFAFRNDLMDFFVTRVGCGLAGHSDVDIAPMFRKAPSNCSLPDTWRPILESQQAP